MVSRHLGINMTFDEILKEDLLNEARKSTKPSGDDTFELTDLGKKYANPNNSKPKRLKADDRVELTPEAKKKLRKHKDPNWKDNDPEFLPGRERLVSAVSNRCGSNPSAVRRYITKMFYKWFDKDPEADWIARAEERAKELGFDPRHYRTSRSQPMPRGKSAGVGEKERAGRSYFFVTLMNRFSEHFLKGKEKRAKYKLSKGQKAKKLKKDK